MTVALTQNYPLGSTAPADENENYLGTIGHFIAKDPDDRAEITGPKYGMGTKAIWVKNEKGSAILPGEGCIWDVGTTYGPFKAAKGDWTSGTNIGVGVADPWLPSAGVANDEHFWMVFWGYCKFQFTTGTALGIGDAVAVGAAGRVVDLDHTSLSDQLLFDRCGTALEAVASGTASDTLFDAFADFRW